MKLPAISTVGRCCCLRLWALRILLVASRFLPILLYLNGKAIGESSSENYSIEAVGNFKEALETFRGSRSISDKELPSGSDKILRGYQKTGIQYLKQVTDFGLGACLADDMGLGKTLQLLTLAKIWKKAGLFADLPALIVLPLTLMENWCLECSKFASELNVVKLHRAYLGNEDFKKLVEQVSILPQQIMWYFLTAGGILLSKVRPVTVLSE